MPFVNPFRSTSTPEASPASQNSDPAAGKPGEGDPGKGDPSGKVSENYKPLQTGIWDNKPDDKSSGDSAQPTQPAQPAQPASPENAVKEHLESLNLTSGIDINQIQTDIAAGNGESLQAAFEQVASNTYMQSLKTLDNLVNAKLEKAVEKAVSESTGSVKVDQAILQMNKEIPFTELADAAPIANRLLTRFMEKGESIKDAIQSVNNTFKDFGTVINEQYDDIPGNKSGSTEFGNNNQDELPNWFDVVGHKKS